MKKETLNKRITIRMTETQHRKITSIVNERHITMTDIILEALKALYHI